MHPTRLWHVTSTIDFAVVRDLGLDRHLALGLADATASCARAIDTLPLNATGCAPPWLSYVLTSTAVVSDGMRTWARIRWLFSSSDVCVPIKIVPIVYPLSVLHSPALHTGYTHIHTRARMHARTHALLQLWQPLDRQRRPLQRVRHDQVVQERRVLLPDLRDGQAAVRAYDATTSTNSPCIPH